MTRIASTRRPSNEPDALAGAAPPSGGPASVGSTPAGPLPSCTPGGGEAGTRFRRALAGTSRERSSLQSDGDPGGAEASFTADHVVAPWLRVEAPAQGVPVTQAPSPARTSADLSGIQEVARTVDRLLVGTAAGVPEARLTLAGRGIEGAQIRLREVAGVIEVALLTSTEVSRQTLRTVMDEVDRRLRMKGHALRPATGVDAWASALDPGREALEPPRRGPAR